MKNNLRKIYIIWFLILVLPPILLRLGTMSGDVVFLSQNLAEILTIITKIGVVILTVWYGLKIGIKDIFAWVLGLSTVLPFVVWISFIILLVKKENIENSLKEKTNNNQEKKSVKNTELENNSSDSGVISKSRPFISDKDIGEISLIIAAVALVCLAVIYFVD